MGYRIASAIAAMLLATGTAAAADLPPRLVPVYAPVAVAPPFSWTGIYFGVNAGYGFAQATESIVGGLSTSEDLNGPVGGGQFGGNYQIGSFVIGLEVDGMASGQKKTTTFGALLPLTIEDKVTWLTTARVRVGGAIDRVLLFASAGGAYGEFTSTVTMPLFGSSNVSTQRAGFVVGAGAEFAFTAGLIGRIEYLYVRSADKDIMIFGTTLSNHLSDNIVRVALSYKFGPGF